MKNNFYKGLLTFLCLFSFLSITNIASADQVRIHVDDGSSTYGDYPPPRYDHRPYYPHDRGHHYGRRKHCYWKHGRRDAYGNWRPRREVCKYW